MKMAHRDSVRLIEEMNRYYEARAPWHDSYMSYKSLAAMEESLKSVIETVAPMVAVKNVLEIACGTGNWTQVLSRRAKCVTALDISPSALAIAEDKLRDFTNVTLVQHSAYELETFRGRFDVLFAADWWSHIPMGILPAFLRSILTRLEKGSMAVFLDMSTNDYFEQERCFFDSDGNRVSERVLPDGSKYKVVKNFPTEDELRGILAPFAGDISYFEFTALQRWLVAFEVW